MVKIKNLLKKVGIIFIMLVIIVVLEILLKNVESKYFILYNGYEISADVGIQYPKEMEISEENNKKYNIEYYNYENGQNLGKTKGEFGEETYEGLSSVSNVKKIATSKKINAYPRNFENLKEIPNQLVEKVYTSTEAKKVDLDNDNKSEYIVCYKKENGAKEAFSQISLFDDKYDKIADLVTLENGFWANLKDEDHQIFLSIEDVECIDLDGDNILEIIVNIPTYEGEKISIVKYKNEKIEGEINIEASVLP